MSKKFRILYNENRRTVSTDDSDSGSEFGMEDTTASPAIYGLQEVDEGFWDVIADKDAAIYYLLFVLYDTGDSFHRDENMVEFVDLFTDEETACANARLIREDDKNRSVFNGFTVKLHKEDGTTYDVHTPWKGYFERLRSVVVQPLMKGGGSF